MFPLHPHHVPGAIIRPLHLGEARPLAEALAGMDPWGRLGFKPAVLTTYLEKRDGALSVYGIEIGGHLAGGMTLRYPWLKGPYLELLAVLPAYQKHGLGRLALEWAMARARHGGAGNLWACVSAFNTPARAFYHRLGFVETCQLDDLVRDGEAEMLLRKRL